MDIKDLNKDISYPSDYNRKIDYSKTDTAGKIIFYINVGELKPEDVKAYIDKIQQAINVAK
jgi:hypothetical protein